MANFRTAMRAAAVTLLTGYKAANDDALKQIYPGRPASIFPPCAFVDGINEPDITYTASLVQRVPRAEIRLVQGTFDSADSVDGQDALVDGFIQYVIDNKHAAGANTLVQIAGVQDEPGWVPEWFPPDAQRPYYSSIVILEGVALDRD
jgi:hypothetical protein